MVGITQGNFIGEVFSGVGIFQERVYFPRGLLSCGGGGVFFTWIFSPGINFGGYFPRGEEVFSGR